MITEVAKTAFAELGYHGLSIRDIAKRTDMSLSALYYYYANKHDLLKSILSEGIDDYRRILDRRLSGAAEGPVAQFDALTSGLIEYRATHQIESRLMLTELRYLEPSAQEELTKPQRDATIKMASVIEAGREMGVFDTPYPDEARRAVWAMCNSIAQWYDPQGELSLDEVVKRCLHCAHSLVGYHGGGNVVASAG
ncbi:TetR family transcriptional regulator [Rhodococcus pseudokoreensis]|uniref:TetR family transcriptional regulator n=1 Tax=Rhodococcus pseudokoreensis TaxID=2811421 RepID=A0A974W5L5_9NOCA|nr:TetR/AcrR family transcriptional regulator [Rhodococcus pseudokoreensis]QSE90798.1 TetR family transcriptional regulator [Rhodococcus pseudokoreensis]